MASVERRVRGDGGVSWRIRWYENGRQESRTFHDEKSARRVANLIAGYGHLPPELLATPEPPDQPATPTVAQAVEHHATRLTGVTERTRDEYRRLARRHLGVLADRPVDTITRTDIAAWTNQITGRLAPKTVANLHGALSAVFTTAVDEGWRVDNPARGVRLPRPDTDASEMRFLTPAEFLTLLEHIPDQYRLLVLLLGATGLRWGEVTALQVRDVDLNADTPTIRVRRAWKREPDGMVLGPPKTRRGRRTVSLPGDVAEVVAEVVRGRPPGSLLVASPEGRPVHHGNFRYRVWLPAVKAAGLDPPPRIHDLRHSHASWLLAKGVPLQVVQRRLGHESITTTVDTYGHLMPDLQRQAAEAVPLLVPAGRISELEA